MKRLLFTVLSCTKKALHWGPRGVLSYARTLRFRRRIRRTLLASRRGGTPVPGITLIGQFTQYGSPCKVVRDFAHALRQAGIPFQTFNVDADRPRVTAAELDGILTPVADFVLDRYDHIVELMPSIVPASVQIPRARIAFWEFDSGFLFGYPEMPYEEHVIAMSDFNAAHFRELLPARVKVSKVLYPFQWEAPDDLPARDDVRRRYGIAPDAVAVLFNFDYGAGYHRKNPYGALEAFARAFRDTPDAQMVVKTKSADTHPARRDGLVALAARLGIADKVVFINESVPQRDLFGLVAACDIYLSLHRGEGFGITLAEAMSMAKPVVCTDWSATTEFCKPACTLTIPYTRAPVDPEQKLDQPFYEDVTTWAEPDLAAAAAALRKLYDDPAYRLALGEKGRASILEQFSTENFRASVNAFLAS